MKKRTIANWAGGILLLGHYGLLPVGLYFVAKDGFTWEEFGIALAIMGPMIAAHTTSFVKHIVRHRLSSAGSQGLTIEYAVMVLFMTGALVGSLAAVIFLWANKVVVQEFGEVIALLGIVETMYGVLLGLAIDPLY